MKFSIVVNKPMNLILNYFGYPTEGRFNESTYTKDFENLDKADEIISKEYSDWKEKYKKEAEYFPGSELYFYYATPKYGISSAVVSAISQQEVPNKTLVFVSDDQNMKGFIKMSARNQTGNIKLGEVLKKCTEGFEEANAGGHDKAAAGGFPIKYLDEFKARLIKELEK